MIWETDDWQNLLLWKRIEHWFWKCSGPDGKRHQWYETSRRRCPRLHLLIWIDNTLCLPSCSGNSLQACGGPGYALVYLLRSSVFTSTSSYSTVAGNGKYNFHGCYTDAATELLENSGAIATNMQSPASVEYCLNLCSGYPFIGIENTNQVRIFSMLFCDFVPIEELGVVARKCNSWHAILC